MKILALGDFHGSFPKKIRSIIRKEKIDIVLSNGDYAPFWYRKVWFKHCYGTNVALWEVIGKKKVKSFILKDLEGLEHSLRGLNSLPVPVYTTIGNLDYSRKNDFIDDHEYYKKHGGKDIAHWNWEEQDFFSKILKKYPNVECVFYKCVKIGDYWLIGAYGGMVPGMPKSKAFRKHMNLLNKFFSNHRKDKIIFLSHNVPNNTKLDKIGKHAHKAARGKHFGSLLVRKAIDKWQPLVHIGGHIHEGRGVQKLGKTTCVNPGAVHEGEAAIIELEGKKVRTRLIRI